MLYEFLGRGISMEIQDRMEGYLHVFNPWVHISYKHKTKSLTLKLRSYGTRQVRSTSRTESHNIFLCIHPLHLHSTIMCCIYGCFCIK